MTLRTCATKRNTVGSDGQIS